MKSIESIDKTAKSIGAFDSINYGVYYDCVIKSSVFLIQWAHRRWTYRLPDRRIDERTFTAMYRASVALRGKKNRILDLYS